MLSDYKLPRPERLRYYLLSLHERVEHSKLLGSMYSLAFIRYLIVHGVLRANITEYL